MLLCPLSSPELGEIEVPLVGLVPMHSVLFLLMSCAYTSKQSFHVLKPTFSDNNSFTRLFEQGLKANFKTLENLKNQNQLRDQQPLLGHVDLQVADAVAECIDGLDQCEVEPRVVAPWPHLRSLELAVWREKPVIPLARVLPPRAAQIEPLALKEALFVSASLESVRDLPFRLHRYQPPLRRWRCWLCRPSRMVWPFWNGA
jgi:hypothetical protein